MQAMPDLLTGKPVQLGIAEDTYWHQLAQHAENLLLLLLLLLLLTCLELHYRFCLIC